MKNMLINANTSNSSILEKLAALTSGVLFSSAFFVITYIIFIGFRNEPPIPLPIPVHYIANFNTPLEFIITPFRISLVIYFCLISLDYLLVRNLKAIPYILLKKLYMMFFFVPFIYAFQIIIFVFFEFDINYVIVKYYVIFLILNLIAITLILSLALLLIHPEPMSSDEFLRRIKEYYTKHEKLTNDGEFVDSEKGGMIAVIFSVIMTGSILFFTFMNLSANPFQIIDSGVKLFLLLSPFVFYLDVYLIHNRKRLAEWLKLYKLTFQKSEIFDEITPDMFRCKIIGSSLNKLLCSRISFRINNAKFIAEGLISEYYQNTEWNIDDHLKKQTKKIKLLKEAINLIFYIFLIIFYFLILKNLVGSIIGLNLVMVIYLLFKHYQSVFDIKHYRFSNRLLYSMFSKINVIKSFLNFIYIFFIFFVMCLFLTAILVLLYGDIIAIVGYSSLVLGGFLMEFYNESYKNQKSQDASS
jgi:hypothetical protein